MSQYKVSRKGSTMSACHSLRRSIGSGMALLLVAAAPLSAREESAAERTPRLPVLRQWPPLPEGRTSFGAASLDGALYLYGGHVGRAHAYSRDAVRGDL